MEVIFLAPGTLYPFQKHVFGFVFPSQHFIGRNVRTEQLQGLHPPPRFCRAHAAGASFMTFCPSQQGFAACRLCPTLGHL